VAKQKPKSSLAFRLAAGEKEAVETVRPKPKPKPKPRPQAKPVSFSSNLVFDPTGQFSDILSDEQKARRDLYLERTGRELADEADERVALESVGLLKPGIGSAERKKVGGGASNEFASALDAIDAEAGKGIKSALFGAATVLNPASLFVTTEPGREALGFATEKWLGRGVDTSDSREKLRQAREAMKVEPGQVTGGGARGAGAPVTAGLKKTKPLTDVAIEAFGEVPAGLPGPPVIMPTGLGQAYDVVSPTPPRVKDVNAEIQNVATRSNDYVDVTRKAPIVIPDSNEGTEYIFEYGKTGATPSQLDAALVDSNPFSADALVALRGTAVENGWDVGDWDELPLGEKVYRAVNQNNNKKLFFRSVVRQIGEVGAAPAGVKAIVDAAAAAAFRGDTEEGSRVFEAAISPYVYADRAADERGFWAAVGEFIRDNPVDALTIFMSAAKGVSVGGGVGARAGFAGSRAQRFAARGRAITVRGEEAKAAPSMPEEVPLPEYSPSPGVVGQSALRQRLAENARVARQRAATAAENKAARDVYEEQQRRFEETGEMVDVTPEVMIGRAGRGIAGTLVTEFAKAPAARRIAWYRKRLEKKAAQRQQRFDVNVAQGEGLELRATITRLLGEGSSELVKDRAAFNLIYPAVDADGVAVTPAYVARFFEAELEDHRAMMARRKEEEGGPAAKYDEQKERRLVDQIARMRELDAVEIDPVVMARLRAGVKPIAEIIEAHMAKALGMSPEEARRANYIRLVAMDRRLSDDGLEGRAQALYRERNEPIAELVAVQARLKRLGIVIQARARETGWGKYGPAKSRKRFREVMNQMMRDLVLAERLALQNNNRELADVFAAARKELAAAKIRTIGSRGASIGLVDDLARVALTDEQKALLTPQARMEYEAAERAVATATEARGVEAAALERGGLRRVNEGNLVRAEERLADARAKLAAYQSFPNPDEKQVARLQAKVDKAEAARNNRLEALDAGRTARKAERIRDRRLKRAIIESNRKVLDTFEVKAALDVSERFAVMEIKTRRELFFRVDRARLETLDAFISRLEASDQNPLLHLVQSQDYEDVGRALVIESDKKLSTNEQAFIRKGRFVSSTGYTFINGLESAKLWENLLRDTIEVKTAQTLQARLNQLVQATSIPYRFNNDALRRAQREVENDPELSALAKSDEALGGNEALRRALARIMQQPKLSGRVDLTDINDWVVLNIADPNARTVSGRLSFGASRASSNQDLGVFVMRTIDARTIDPEAPGDYYLMPRSVYDGIQKAIADESFTFKKGGIGSKLDRITRLWRTITLNVLPRTAINNTIGSTILAIQGGAGPRAMYYAARAIAGKPVRLSDGSKRALPVPLELRQRYYEQITDPLADTKGAFKPIAHWMNMMRYFNGISEDFGRLAVWYHRAYPEAMRSEQGVLFLRSARRLNDKSVEMLEAMSRRDPNYATLMDEFTEQAFNFLGDLHKGGQFASAMRIAIPFWQWYAHMLKLTFFTMPFKYPKRALFMQMLGEVGRDYQERMGVSVPWGESFVPFFSDYIDTPSGVQQVVGGANLGNWWPQATVSPVGSEGGAIGFLQGGISPFWTNSALIGLSLASASLGGTAFETDDRTVLGAAKDEFGLPIEDVISPEFGAYVVNHFFRMVPLSPTMMSLGGRASNAIPLPGAMEEKTYRTEQLPQEYRQATRADLPSVIEEIRSGESDLFSRDWWRSNVAAFIVKATLGSPVNYMPGQGPLAAQRLFNDYMFAVEDLEDRERAILEAMLRRHDYSVDEGKNR
jgi:hypothetical protein